MRALVLISFFIALEVGCTSRNVTSLPKYRVGYVPEHVYRLKVERELVQTDWSAPNIFVLLEPGAVTPSTDWLTSVGRLAAGTRIRIEELRYETTIALGDVYREVVAYGRVLDGPHAGTMLQMSGVSKWIDFPQAILRSDAMKPDPALVEDLGIQ